MRACSGYMRALMRGVLRLYDSTDEGVLRLYESTDEGCAQVI